MEEGTQKQIPKRFWWWTAKKSSGRRSVPFSSGGIASSPPWILARRTTIIQHGLEFALIVVEISLAPESGLEFVNRLPPQPRRVPVLFLTAKGEWEADTVRNLFPVLEKPFRADTFMTTVKTVVSGI